MTYTNEINMLKSKNLRLTHLLFLNDDELEEKLV